MVAAALTKALMALCRAPSTLAAPAVASSRVSRSGLPARGLVRAVADRVGQGREGHGGKVGA